MKFIQTSELNKVVLNKEYDFIIIAANVIAELRKVQVLFRLTEVGEKVILPEDVIVYVQEYEIDVTPESEFMSMLEWCEPAEFMKAFYYDTEALEGVRGTCKIVHDSNGIKRVQLLEQEETHIVNVTSKYNEIEYLYIE